MRTINGKQNAQSVWRSERGIASLLVTMVLMIIISLIVIGFGQVARREQRNALDRQLSTQAFYAAETGINDAQAAINNALKNNQVVVPKKDCTNDSLTSNNIYNSDTTGHKLTYKVNGSDVKYTCLLVDTQVQYLQQQMSADGDWVTRAYPVDGDGHDKQISQLQVTWPSENDGNDVTGCPGVAAGNYIANPTSTDWTNCDYGLMRLDVVPVAPGAPLSRASLAGDDMVVFAYPSASGSTTFDYRTGLSSGSKHQVQAKCNPSNSERTCSITIANLKTSAGTLYPAGTTFYIRAHMLYKSTGDKNVQINVPGGSTFLTGTQAQIDSTGKAQDVLRRIRATVNLTTSSSYSPYALLTRDSICKRYTVADNIAPSNQVSSDMSNDGENTMCTTSTPVQNNNISDQGGDSGTLIDVSQGNGPKSSLSWKRTYKISDIKNSSAITGCSWYFDYQSSSIANGGSHHHDYGQANVGSKCSVGSADLLDYSDAANDGFSNLSASKCYHPTPAVVLTQKSGSPIVIKFGPTLQTTVPHGTDAPSGCEQG